MVRLLHVSAAPFEAARRVSVLPEGHRSRRLHGHGYLVRLHLSAPLDQVMGWVMDYGDVKARFQSVYRQLDHQLLNELPRLGDTDSASLARWLREEAAAELPQLDRIDLQKAPGCGVLLCWGDSDPAPPS